MHVLRECPTLANVRIENPGYVLDGFGSDKGEEDCHEEVIHKFELEEYGSGRLGVLRTHFGNCLLFLQSVYRTEGATNLVPSKLENPQNLEIYLPSAN